MAKCSRAAPPNVRWRQDFLPWCVLGGRSWQYSRAMRSWAAIRGNFLASCIPEGASDGKSAPSWQHIAAVYPKRAGFGKICAPCIRKAPQTAFRECMARRSCQGGALFAALTPRITHGAQILPSHRLRQTARTPATPAPRPHRITAGIGSSISDDIRIITVSLVRHASCVQSTGCLP